MCPNEISGNWQVEIMIELRYGIMSTSSIAPRFVNAVREAGAGEIVAISSRTLTKAQEKAELWGIPKAYGSHQALLEDDNVNIVYISSVNSEHYILAKQALEMGKHVICEKPCTTSSEDTRRLFSLAREKGLFLMEAQKMLFLPTILEIRNRIASGELGEIYMAQLTHSFSSGYNSWQFEPSLGGGTLLSSGIYAVQLLQFLFGEIAQISGVRSVLENGGEWQYAITGRMACDVLFTIQNSTRVSLENCAKIYGTKGYVVIPEYWKARKAIIYKQGVAPETIEFPCEYELIYESSHIAKCIQEGRTESPVVTEDVSVAGISALEAVIESWK